MMPPLEYSEKFIIILDNGREDSKWWRGKRETVQNIFDFRRILIASLEASLDET